MNTVSRRIAVLRLAILLLSAPASVFWRAAAWRAWLETRLANMEGE